MHWHNKKNWWHLKKKKKKNDKKHWESILQESLISLFTYSSFIQSNNDSRLRSLIFWRSMDWRYKKKLIIFWKKSKMTLWVDVLFCYSLVRHSNNAINSCSWISKHLTDCQNTKKSCMKNRPLQTKIAGST